MMQEIFIVDDEIDIRTLVKDILVDEGYKVREFSSAADFLNALEETKPILVLLDIWLKGSEIDGIGLLDKIKKKYLETNVVMISGHGNIEIAVSSIKNGAYDFIEKPFNSDRLLLVVSRAIQNANLLQENKALRYKNKQESSLIGTSSKITNLKNQVEKASQTSSRILISGAPGTGKEVVARAIHTNSDRKDNPFVIFNCATMNAYGLEMELINAFKEAGDGTIVLDEICDLPLIVQGKLLKMLQDSSDNEFESTRVISITNQDITAKIEQGLFREDLYYRLNVIPLTVPSLSGRKEDIILFANHFMEQYCDSMSITFKGFTDQAIVALKSYEWEGNVRQLRNTMEWLSIMLGDKLSTSEITLDMLPVEIYSTKINLVPEVKRNSDYFSLPLKDAREEFEREYMERQILQYGNISKIADLIGMDRASLHRKLKQLGIEYKK